jgi:hypothetical protein
MCQRHHHRIRIVVAGTFGFPDSPLVEANIGKVLQSLAKRSIFGLIPRIFRDKLGEIVFMLFLHYSLTKGNYLTIICHRETGFLILSLDISLQLKGIIAMKHSRRIPDLLVRSLAIVLSATAIISQSVKADITVTLDSSAPWQGFMNVFELDRSTTPPSRGNFVFGSGWGFNDLTAVFNGNVLTLGPNTIGDPDPFWYIGGGGTGALGNKWMDANGFIQQSNNPVFSGQNVTFTGTVLSNTFTPNHTAQAFIRDFAPDFSTFNETSVLLTPGNFSITLATDPGAGRHVQYGFNVAGENVWITDVGPFGTVQVGAIPEPGSAVVLMLGALGLISRRRR